jgi:hypothetical protein
MATIEPASKAGATRGGEKTLKTLWNGEWRPVHKRANPSRVAYQGGMRTGGDVYRKKAGSKS